MKSSLVLACLALPLGTLAAQQPAAPPSPNPAAVANPFTTTLRGRTMAYQRNLAQAFDSIPGNIFGYSPTPAQQTIGYVAQHLANDNYLFCERFGSMQANRPTVDTATPDTVKAIGVRSRPVTGIARLRYRRLPSHGTIAPAMINAV